MRRRSLLSLATAAVSAGLVATLSTAAFAQVTGGADKWPERPVKVILPYAPGGATDLIGRPWADRLTQEFKQQFVVENRGGASGTIGTEAAAKAPADGYTLLLTPNSALTVITNFRKTAYDPIKSFEPVGRVGDLLGGFVVHPSVGVKTMKDLVEHAKKNPGKLAFGSAGPGTSTHLRIEVLKFRAGVDILHVPYRGSADALNDLLPGTIHMMNEINVLPHVKAGKLNLLAISSQQRHPDFPDAPTLTEAGFPDSDVPVWYSVWAPAGTPKDILKKLHDKVVEVAKGDEMIAKMRAINVVVPVQTPEEMLKYTIEDIKRNGDIIKAANIKLE
jgi:tripartite-type tricarboxylate transporter receptor subunit TctC